MKTGTAERATHTHQRRGGEASTRGGREAARRSHTALWGLIRNVTRHRTGSPPPSPLTLFHSILQLLPSFITASPCLRCSLLFHLVALVLVVVSCLHFFLVILRCFADFLHLSPSSASLRSVGMQAGPRGGGCVLLLSQQSRQRTSSLSPPLNP